MLELSRDVVESLRDPRPEDTFGVVGCDPGGGRDRVVYPLFGSDNVHHFCGREFEAARGGTPQSIRVGRVLDSDKFLSQILLWREHAVFRSSNGLLQATGPEALRASVSLGIDPCLEVRTAVLRPNPEVPGKWVATLATGEPIKLVFPADPVSIHWPDEDTVVWFVVGDDAVDIEERELLREPLPELEVMDSAWPPTSGEPPDNWVLVPTAADEEPFARLYPVASVPFFAGDHLGRVNWVGTVPGGESPVVLTLAQVTSIRERRASDELRNAVRHAVLSRALPYREALRNGASIEDSAASYFGLQKYVALTPHRMSARSVVFGRKAEVSQAKPSSVVAEVESLPDSAR